MMGSKIYGPMIVAEALKWLNFEQQLILLRRGMVYMQTLQLSIKCVKYIQDFYGRKVCTWMESIGLRFLVFLTLIRTIVQGHMCRD